MDQAEMKRRTKAFALRVLKLVKVLPTSMDGRAIAGQLVRCGTSVGANCRSACRGRSRADFIAKLGIVEEEADETCFWLELIIEDNMLDKTRVEPLLKEANEILAIIVASKKTAKQRLERQQCTPNNQHSGTVSPPQNRQSSIANRKSPHAGRTSARYSTFPSWPLPAPPRIGDGITRSTRTPSDGIESTTRRITASASAGASTPLFSCDRSAS